MNSGRSMNSLDQPPGEPYSKRNSNHLIQPSSEPSTASNAPNAPPKISNTNNNNVISPTSPICRCRVMYLGSSVPHITKDGLQGIQEPLRELYPDRGVLDSGNAGIDSWLSVWSNGILIENVDERGKEVKKFFKIDALHYCAAVKYVEPSAYAMNHLYNTISGNSISQPAIPKFLPLDSPHAMNSRQSPPVFASIIRRTTGIKVLECHAFICKREAAANALVRCCFHAYADTMYAKQIGADLRDSSSSIQAGKHERDLNNNVGGGGGGGGYQLQDNDFGAGSNCAIGLDPVTGKQKSKSIANLLANGRREPSEIERTSWKDDSFANSRGAPTDCMPRRGSSTMEQEEGRDRCKTLSGSRSNLLLNEDLRKQGKKFSKSLHQLNQEEGLAIGGKQLEPFYNQADKEQYPSTSASCLNVPASSRRSWATDAQQVPVPPPFHNPYSARVPSYPPQDLMEQVSSNNGAGGGGGTLRSIKSMAANSIASTLLRSKKQATKAMSLAQLNQNAGAQADKVISFHQPHLNAMTFAGGPLVVGQPAGGVPSMFLPNMPAAHLSHLMMSGSQTMKVPGRQQPMLPFISSQPAAAPALNFETLTPKEIKKLLKKSAKYGLEPANFAPALENGLPLLAPGATKAAPHLMPAGQGPLRSAGLAPPPLGPYNLFAAPGSDLATNHDVPDLYSGSLSGSHMARTLPHQHTHPASALPFDPSNGPLAMKPLLVKPSPEFLKSKAGKKWLKQQKEFKKLLPPHLDGLPIIFGPPPPPMNGPESAAGLAAPGSLVAGDGLPAPGSPPGSAYISLAQPQPQPQPHSQHQLPVLAAPGSLAAGSGYLAGPAPPFHYGYSGRASAASTLLRYSPHSAQAIADAMNGLNGPLYDNDCWKRPAGQPFYGETMPTAHGLPGQQASSSSYSLADDSSTILASNNASLLAPQSHQLQGFGSRSCQHLARHPAHHVRDVHHQARPTGFHHHHHHQHQHQHQHQQQPQQHHNHRRHAAGSSAHQDGLAYERANQHMVEQSVICLGEENDDCDDDCDNHRADKDDADADADDDDEDGDGDGDGQGDGQAGADSEQGAHRSFHASEAGGRRRPSARHQDEPQNQSAGYYSARANHSELQQLSGSRGLSAATGDNRRLSSRETRDMMQLEAAAGYANQSGRATNCESLNKGSYQQQQQQQASDDQNSYSSGIYKRGHLNERAFSHSIREEHKSELDYAINNRASAAADTSDSACLYPRGAGIKQQQQQRHPMAPNHSRANLQYLANVEAGGAGVAGLSAKRVSQILHSNSGNNYNNNHNHNHNHTTNHNSANNYGMLSSAQVNELTSRLEDQLSVNSFVNSRIKSHM